jgi:EAL and modified HD-GYP domain-containing signal transduction protein
MVGLFSTLDTLMDAPMDELLATLPIADDIRNALLYRSGPYAPFLICALGYEKGDWPLVENAGFSEVVTASCYFQAAEWSNEASGQLLVKAA